MISEPLKIIGSYDDGHTPSGLAIVAMIGAVIMFFVVMKSFFNATDKHGVGGSLIAIVGMLAVAVAVVVAVYLYS